MAIGKTFRSVCIGSRDLLKSKLNSAGHFGTSGSRCLGVGFGAVQLVIG